MDLKTKVAAILKKTRAELKYAAEYVTCQLREYGFNISPITLRGYENGVSQPKADMFLCLCKIYGLQSFDIFFDDVNDNNFSSLYNKLNALGQQKALDYVNDLSENTKYTNKISESKPSISAEIADDITKLINMPTHTKSK